MLLKKPNAKYPRLKSKPCHLDSKNLTVVAALDSGSILGTYYGPSLYCSLESTLLVISGLSSCPVTADASFPDPPLFQVQPKQQYWGTLQAPSRFFFLRHVDLRSFPSHRHLHDFLWRPEFSHSSVIYIAGTMIGHDPLPLLPVSCKLTSVNRDVKPPNALDPPPSAP